ncbi:hypothetical protein [Halospeciosus flavus]|uniref:Uncharacterized protein n=1 Tax=Halospeciosus flavus TaxID=3032283 RepID=A0ABD5Z8C9_9EURY|nr:hypothetical protein [Halospeciosus flavus]
MIPHGAPIDEFTRFAVGLLVGGAAISVGANRLARPLGYDHAVLTALLGAAAWALLAPVPLIGTVLALAAWVGVIRWRYPVGWARAAGIGLLAWAAATLALAALALLGVDASFPSVGTGQLG